MSAIEFTELPESIDAPVVRDLGVLRNPQGPAAKEVYAEWEAHRKSEKSTSKTGIKAMALSKGDTFDVSIYELDIDPEFNCRDMDSPATHRHIDELARSIARWGVREPMKAYMKGNRLTVTNGECRYWATFRAIEVYNAKISSVPVRTEARGTDEIERLYTQETSNQVQEFSMLERGKLYRRIHMLGHSIPKIAANVGKTVAFVTACIDLQGAPEAAKQMVRMEKLSETELLAQVRSGKTDAEIVDAVTKGAEIAEAKGRTRIMPRDIVEGETGEKPLSPKKLIKQVFADAKQVDETDDKVIFEMSIENWKLVERFLAGK
jgi:hypothetical protein